MCGIIAFFGNKESSRDKKFRTKFRIFSKRIRHRYADWNGIYSVEGNVLIGHERLSIVST